MASKKKFFLNFLVCTYLAFVSLDDRIMQILCTQMIIITVADNFILFAKIYAKKCINT